LIEENDKIKTKDENKVKNIVIVIENNIEKDSKPNYDKGVNEKLLIKDKRIFRNVIKKLKLHTLFNQAIVKHFNKLVENKQI
jgi:hypothetical protein